MQQEILTEWKNDNNEFIYPYSVERGNWDELTSIQEARERNQIPSELADSLTTAELLDLVLNYPLLCELDNYEALTIGYQRLKQNFDAIDTLLSRTDAYDEILKAYQEFYIPQERLISYPENDGSQAYVDEINRMLQDNDLQKAIMADGRIYNSINLMELMLLELSEDNSVQQENALMIIDNKTGQKEISEYYSSVSTSSVRNDLAPNELFYKESNLQASSYVDGQMYTFTSPAGGQYTAQYSSSTASMDPYGYDDLVIGHATLIATATTAYNCHSFSFLQGINDMYQNLILHTTGPLTTDGTYHSISATNATSGDILLWSGHSARLIELNRPNPYNNGIPEPYIVNKLGAGPVVTEFLSFCSFYHDESITYLTR